MVGVTVPGERLDPWVGGTPDPDGLLTLVLPPVGEMVVEVVDVAGEPVPAEIGANRVVGVEVLDASSARIRSRRALQPVRIAAEGHLPLTARVPVDGGTHAAVLGPPGRHIALSLRCDEACPTDLRCDAAPCEDSGEASFACLCPAGRAPLWGQQPGRDVH